MFGDDQRGCSVGMIEGSSLVQWEDEVLGRDPRGSRIYADMGRDGEGIRGEILAKEMGKGLAGKMEEMVLVARRLGIDS